MINRKVELINKIEEKLIQWDSFIKIRGRSGLYDIHKYSENNIRDILNILYNYNLKNLGISSPTFPIIDLGDLSNGLCFQVTANKSAQCYSELETRFLSSELNLKSQYPKLHVFILSGFIDDRKGLIKATKNTGLDDSCVLDFKTILDKMRDLSNEEDYKLDRILNILDKNYICYNYFNMAINNYREVNKRRFEPSNTYTEPHIIEEESNPFKPKSNRKENNEKEEYTLKELSKITFHQASEIHPQFILTGDAGSGKSEVIRNAYYNIICNNSSLLPVYIDIGKRYTEKDVVSLIYSELEKAIGEQADIDKEKLVEELTKQLLLNNELYLLIDGYDEMDKTFLEKWNENIRAFLVLNPATRLIIAVRKNRILQDVTLPINKIYGILPFDDEQIENYIRALLIENGQHSDQTRVKFIKSTVSQSKLFLTAPTLIIKMLIQYASIQNNHKIKIPNTKSDAYRNYFEYVILKKLKSSGISDAIETIPGLYDDLINETHNILSKLALLNFQNSTSNNAQIDFHFLNATLEKIEVKNNHRYLFQKGINFFINELQIIKSESQKNYFNHFTYQEFFFAIWLHKRTRPFSTVSRWVKSAYIVAKYNQVFMFLIGLMNENEAAQFFNRLEKWPFKIWVRLAKSLDKITLTKFYFICEMAVESNLSKERTQDLSTRLFNELKPRNEMSFEKICKLLSKLSPNSETILNKIIELICSDSSWVKKQGLKHYALPYIKQSPKFKKSIYELLNAKKRYDRDIGIEVLKEGKVFDDDIVNKVFDLHFLPEDDSENEGFRYMTEYSKEYPEKCVDYASKYLKFWIEKNKEGSEPISLFLRYYFAHIMKIPGYDEEIIKKEVLKYLYSENNEINNQAILIRALYKTGVRSRLIINTLLNILNKETPLATAIFMYYRDLFIVKPEIIELACKYLYSDDTEARRRAMNYLAHIRYDGSLERNGLNIRIAERAFEIISEKHDPERPDGTKQYAVEYLANIKYIDNKVTNVLIEKLNDVNQDYLHSYIIRYLMSIKFYSPSFFTLMFNLQTTGFSWESNQYFENIENYIPENKLKEAKEQLAFYFGKNSFALIKERSSNNSTLINTIENYVRMGLAFQKIILYEDEAKWLSKL